MLDAERARATFGTKELSELLNGKRDAAFRAHAIRVLKEDPVLQRLRDKEPFNSKLESIEDMMEKTLRLHKLVDEHHPKMRGSITRFAEKAGLTFDYAFPPFNSTLISATNGMFITTIRSQMDEEQKKEWLPLATSRQILGTYAQTELGHGSNVRGLETTATYDPATESFIVHSPTVTATKWWPAHLGLGCTHAAVYARCIVKGQDHGVCVFMVQLRDTHTYEPLPGIQLGSSGPTLGHYANEHGRCRFDNVRIPRRNMCMRWNKVSPQGEFTAVEKSSSKTSYITMTQTRVNYVTMAHKNLAKALTVAVRYSCVRKQGYAADGLSETTIMDYGMQRSTMLTLLASCYALRFAARYVNDFAEAALRGIEGRSAEAQAMLDQMPELHATTSGLKALSTKISCEGVEVARQSCGGHGYGLFSGLPQLYNNALRTQTVEGDNNVLCLQVARFLMKAWSELQAGEVQNLAGNVRYLAAASSRHQQRCAVSSEQDWLSPEVQEAAFGHWAVNAVASAARLMEKDQATGMTADEAQNRRMPGLVAMAHAHCYYSLLRCFTEAIVALPPCTSPQTVSVLTALKDLFALSTLQQQLGGITADGWASRHQCEQLDEQVLKLLERLRPEVVALVDAFDFDDVLELHQSALGSYDGNVYQRLWDWSEKDPANNAAEGRPTGTLPPAFEEKWRPLLEYYGIRNAQAVAGQVPGAVRAKL